MKYSKRDLSITIAMLISASLLLCAAIFSGCRKGNGCDRVITMNGVEISRVHDYDISRSTCQFAVDTSAVMDTTIDCNSN
ncbi:MAG: hypothetical protein WCL06_09710 [Bacteroidota bacterium]